MSFAFLFLINSTLQKISKCNFKIRAPSLQTNGVNRLYKIKQVKYEKSADFQNKKKPYEKKIVHNFLNLGYLHIS